MNEKNNKPRLDEISEGFKLGIIHHNIDKFFDRRAKKNADTALPKAQGMTMHYLMCHRDEEIFQKDIEKQFNITGATATNILKGLEKIGLIVRVPLEKDARLKRIVLTEKAFVREKHIIENITTLDQNIIKDFTPQDVEKFNEYLNKVILNIEKLLEDEE